MFNYNLKLKKNKMKKIFSIFALMAMLCIPFCLVSCGDDDDNDTPVKPSTQPGIYTITVSGADDGDTGAKVIDFIKEKLGNDAKIDKHTGKIYTMQVNDKNKADAIIKGLDQYKAEIDRLVKENTNLKSITVTISANLVKLYEYDYMSEEITDGQLMSYGTYTYTDKDGDVWSFTYTDEDAGDGQKVGSIVVPKDINDVKAGTYKGKCKSGSLTIEFNSDEMQEKAVGTLPIVWAKFGLSVGDGVPVTVSINGKQVFRAEMFQKTK